MGYGSKEPSEETQQKATRLLPYLQTTRKGKQMNTTFKDIKKIREDMSLAPKGKGREAAKKLYKERTKASDATRAKLLKPYDGSTRRAINVKVKNAITDLDHIAWQFENQFDTAPGNRGRHLLNQAKVTQRIDRIMKDLKALKDIL